MLLGVYGVAVSSISLVPDRLCLPLVWYAYHSLQMSEYPVGKALLPSVEITAVLGRVYAQRAESG